MEELSVSWVMDLLFPVYCVQCGRSGKYICPICKNEISINHINSKLKKLKIEGCLCLFKFDKVIRLALYDLKYKLCTEIAVELAEIFYDDFVQSFPNLYRYFKKNKFCLIPVPLSTKRYRWRGFNQTELLGRLISKKLNIDFQTNFFRKKDSPTQVKSKTKVERLKNQIGVFEVVRDLPKNVIIFDDVITTGGTIKSILSSINTSVYEKPQKIFVISIAG